MTTAADTAPPQGSCAAHGPVATSCSRRQRCCTSGNGRPCLPRHRSQTPPPSLRTLGRTTHRHLSQAPNLKTTALPWDRVTQHHCCCWSRHPRARQRERAVGTGGTRPVGTRVDSRRGRVPGRCVRCGVGRSPSTGPCHRSWRSRSSPAVQRSRCCRPRQSQGGAVHLKKSNQRRRMSHKYNNQSNTHSHTSNKVLSTLMRTTATA